MKRYLSASWPNSNCFICNEVIALEQLLGQDIRLASVPATTDVQEYKYAEILPYTLAIKLTDLAANLPVVEFLNKDHLFNFEYYDSLGIRYIPAGGGINIAFDSGFTVNTAESLFFPVFGKTNNYVGWQLRFIPGTWNGDRFQFMRYMHLFPKGNHLFNYAFAKQHKEIGRAHV